MRGASLVVIARAGAGLFLIAIAMMAFSTVLEAQELQGTWTGTDVVDVSAGGKSGSIMFNCTFVFSASSSIGYSVRTNEICTSVDFPDTIISTAKVGDVIGYNEFSFDFDNSISVGPLVPDGDIGDNPLDGTLTTPTTITLTYSGVVNMVEEDETVSLTFVGPPVITRQPTSLVALAGSSVSFSIAAEGALTYQWFLNGAAISGATGSTYSLANVQSGSAGTYTAVVTNAGGSVTSSPASLTVNVGVSFTRLTNISARTQVGTGGNILIPGFVIAGSGTETLLIRGDGPSLAQFELSGFLALPNLSVFDSSGKMVAANTGWSTNANASQIASVSSQVGAFGLQPGSADCALLVSLPSGAYTVQVSGLNNSTGIALAEVYEVSSSGTRLTNISTRAQVGTGSNIMIAGFVIAGSGTEQLLVRADGPTLAQFGVAGFLTDPILEVIDNMGNVISSNTAWGTGINAAEVANTSSLVGAFALVAGSADSAQVVSLPAGAYTLQVSGANSTTGVGLGEVYEVP